MLQTKLRPLAQRKPLMYVSPTSPSRAAVRGETGLSRVCGTADDQPPLATEEVARHPQRNPDDARERANLLMG